jgi:hypothetical protein
MSDQPKYSIVWTYEGVGRGKSVGANDLNLIDELKDNPASYLTPYKGDIRRRLGLIENAALFANLLDFAKRGHVLFVRGPKLLLERQARDIDAAHKRLVGTDSPRPRTAEDLAENPVERKAAALWTAELFENPHKSNGFSLWFPAIDKVATNDPGFRLLAKEDLALCCWPIEVTLKQPALVTLYEELVGPILGFTAFADYLVSRATASEVVAAKVFYDCWWKPRLENTELGLDQIRRNLRRARGRGPALDGKHTQPYPIA